MPLENLESPFLMNLKFCWRDRVAMPVVLAPWLVGQTEKEEKDPLARATGGANAFSVLHL